MTKNLYGKRCVYPENVYGKKKQTNRAPGCPARKRTRGKLSKLVLNIETG